MVMYVLMLRLAFVNYFKYLTVWFTFRLLWFCVCVRVFTPNKIYKKLSPNQFPLIAGEEAMCVCDLG